MRMMLLKHARPVLFMVAGAALASVAWHAAAGAGAADNNLYRQLHLFGDVFDRVLNDYVEKPDEEQLVDAAINGMLASLDPHSSYLNPKRFDEMRIQASGEFGGLGIEVTMEKDGLVKVVAPIDDTPAAQAGMLSNDLISHLDGEPVFGLTLGQAVDKMRGRVGDAITLTVIRQGRKEPFEVTIVRDKIRITPVKWRREGREGNIGYIRISSFNEQTQSALEKALADVSEDILKDTGGDIAGYILDLRNNPGGLLDQAVSVTDTFLERGEVVSTRGRYDEDSRRYAAHAGDLAAGKPVVVLINGGSASASEIVAGALQDHDRAEILGTRSFGKGSVQTIIPLNGHGAIRLTTARYYTPSGNSIQARGIEPDWVVEQVLPDEIKEMADKALRAGRSEAGLRGHLPHEAAVGDAGDGDVEKPGSSAYVPKEREKDIQLSAAIAMINGEEISQYLADEDRDE